jgi:hypothetical protein
MNRYKITLAKESVGKEFTVTVTANNEEEANLKAFQLAKAEGIKVPDNYVWTTTVKLPKLN